MSELVLNKKTLKLKFEGESYEMRFPTLEQLIEFGKEMDKKERSEFELGLELFGRLGLPSEVAKELEPDHCFAILEKFNKQGPKKK